MKVLLLNVGEGLFLLAALLDALCDRVRGGKRWKFRNNARKIWCNSRKTLLLHHEKSRSGAEVARQAHNLEVMGSNPVSATKAIRLLPDEEVV